MMSFYAHNASHIKTTTIKIPPSSLPEKETQTYTHTKDPESEVSDICLPYFRALQS